MCEQNNICVFCDHAGMRDDICGTYCVGGFWKNPDGTCDHYKEHQTGTAPARRTSQEELVKALRQMGVLTGGLMCVCCGHEHSCGINGCAVIEAAADALEAQAAEIERVTKERNLSREVAEEIASDFIDYVTGGVPNSAPYCANRRPECTNSRGWCDGNNAVCKGFFPKAARGPKKEA